MKTNIPNFLDNFPQSPKFPGATPREQQIEALEKIRKGFSDGKKYVIARLPTGSGKTHIATSIARSARSVDQERRDIIDTYDVFRKDKNGTFVHASSFDKKISFGGFVLTVTRSLQNQYVEMFPEIIAAKGKNNYFCDVDKNLTADFAPCLFSPELKQDCFNQDRCPYYKTRKNALLSPDSVLNYRAFFNLPEFLQRRQYLICDEADEIEDELISQYSITINYAQLLSEEIQFKKIISDDSEEAFQWLQDVFLQLNEQLTATKHKMSLLANKNNKFEGIMFKQMQRMGKLSNLYTSIRAVIEYWHECEFLVENKDAKEVTFAPLNIKPLAQKFFSQADNIVLMSATISNPEEYAKSLGIKKDEYIFIDAKSSFDPQKSPIYCSTKYSLSYKTLNAQLPKVIDLIARICESHRGQKGIIHTHTNQIASELRKKFSKNKRFLFREIGISNEDIIKEHIERKEEDTILVSPSLDTGVSLDDELGRFQIIVKAPYLPLGSKRIKKVFDKNPKYYTMKMIDKLIQMSGRCTRSKDDHSVTYILDNSAVKAITANKNLLPKYFLERFM